MSTQGCTEMLGNLREKKNCMSLCCASIIIVPHLDGGWKQMKVEAVCLALWSAPWRGLTVSQLVPGCILDWGRRSKSVQDVLESKTSLCRVSRQLFSFSRWPLGSKQLQLMAGWWLCVCVLESFFSVLLPSHPQPLIWTWSMIPTWEDTCVRETLDLAFITIS